ncbi:MAG TPA: zinc ribbon domain-containing protein [Solirubrobacterales bacterium]
MSTATAPAYCSACGTKLNEGAKFCRSCGNPQQPLAAWSPAAPGQVSTRSAGNPLAAWLAIIGGATMCFIALYAVFYLPLHDDYPVNYGESLRLGDVVAVVSGLVAVAIGILTLKRPTDSVGREIWLILAGAPTLIVSLVWAFGDELNLSLYPLPFYFAFVFFTDIGVAHIGPAYVPVPLVLACAMVIAAGVMLASPGRTARPAS